MELKSCAYATVTTLGDFGPWISKVVLDLPCTVRANDIDASTFHIYVERHERTGEILMRKEHGADHAAPSVGYIDVLAAYPCDENGRKLAVGTHVALEVAEQRLTKRSKAASWARACSMTSCTSRSSQLFPATTATIPPAVWPSTPAAAISAPRSRLEQRHAKDPRQWHRARVRLLRTQL